MRNRGPCAHRRNASRAGANDAKASSCRSSSADRRCPGSGDRAIDDARSSMSADHEAACAVQMPCHSGSPVSSAALPLRGGKFFRDVFPCCRVDRIERLRRRRVNPTPRDPSATSRRKARSHVRRRTERARNRSAFRHRESRCWHSRNAGRSTSVPARLRTGNAVSRIAAGVARSCAGSSVFRRDGVPRLDARDPFDELRTCASGGAA